MSYLYALVALAFLGGGVLVFTALRDAEPKVAAWKAMSNANPHSEPDLVTFRLGDETWHDGPGWYYTIDDYPDEGSCGAFATRDEAIRHAQLAGYEVPTDHRKARIA